MSLFSHTTPDQNTCQSCHSSSSSSKAPPSLMVMAIIAGLMLLTRGQHIGGLELLPDASWAIVFMVGLLFSQYWLVPVLFLMGWAVDFAAIEWGGVSSYCMSVAYTFLLPTYAVLFAGGRWVSKIDTTPSHNMMATMSAKVVIGFTTVLLAEIISSGSFYALSGTAAHVSVSGFIPVLVAYFPHSLMTFVGYVSLALAARLGYRLYQSRQSRQSHNWSSHVI